MKPQVIGIAAAVVVVGLGAAYFLTGGDEAAPPAPAAAPAAAPAPSPAPAPAATPPAPAASASPAAPAPSAQPPASGGLSPAPAAPGTSPGGSAGAMPGGGMPGTGMPGTGTPGAKGGAPAMPGGGMPGGGMPGMPGGAMPGASANLQQALVGIWQGQVMSEGVMQQTRATFNADGTFTQQTNLPQVTNQALVIQGTWKLVDDGRGGQAVEMTPTSWEPQQVCGYNGQCQPFQPTAETIPVRLMNQNMLQVPGGMLQRAG
jgi:hypothetical protein